MLQDNRKELIALGISAIVAIVALAVIVQQGLLPIGSDDDEDDS